MDAALDFPRALRERRPGWLQVVADGGGGFSQELQNLGQTYGFLSKEGITPPGPEERRVEAELKCDLGRVGWGVEREGKKTHPNPSGSRN